MRDTREKVTRKITRECMVCGKETTREFDDAEGRFTKGWNAWVGGALIQNAFPFLPVSVHGRPWSGVFEPSGARIFCLSEIAFDITLNLGALDREGTGNDACRSARIAEETDAVLRKYGGPDTAGYEGISAELCRCVEGEVGWDVAYLYAFGVARAAGCRPKGSRKPVIGTVHKQGPVHPGT